VFETLILMEHDTMVMKLSEFKRLFHPVWDQPEDEVEIRFISAFNGRPATATHLTLYVKDTIYDVGKKRWSVDLGIGEPVTETALSHDEPLDSQGRAAGPITHDGTATGVPVADEPSDT